jgi:23S rRNA (adenine2503-C2)-methyltransferase
MNDPNYIFDLGYEDFLSDWILEGEPEYRGRQIWDGIYKNLWSDPDTFSILPSRIRSRLKEKFTFSHLQPKISVISKDGSTHKTLFSLPNGNAIEAVAMHYSKRNTLCISTQSGCAMGCDFCATGKMGFLQNLSSGEIVEQVIYYLRYLRQQNKIVTNIVFMGMGEPFHNYEATMSALDCLNHPLGMNLGARRFTVSTVGIVPGIIKFTRENRQFNLAVSLHAADDELRSSLMPINNRYSISQLINACLDYVNYTHRRISFEWALIQDINDSIDQAIKLSNLLKDFIINGSALCHVNLIPLNPIKKFNGKPSTNDTAKLFQGELLKYKIPCSIRIRRGIDIQAGCGQLAAKELH